MIPVFRPRCRWRRTRSGRVPGTRPLQLLSLLGTTPPPHGPSPDLNLLIAPVNGWVYQQTGAQIYRDQGDQIFNAGVSGAFLSGGKQFSQNYRWSQKYVEWRNLGQPTGQNTGPTAGQPALSVSLTSPTTGASYTTSSSSITITGDSLWPECYAGHLGNGPRLQRHSHGDHHLERYRHFIAGWCEPDHGYGSRWRGPSGQRLAYRQLLDLHAAYCRSGHVRAGHRDYVANLEFHRQSTSSSTINLRRHCIG